MWTILHKFVSWLFSVVSENDGSGSSSRVAMITTVFSVSFSLLFFVIKTRTFPDGNVLLGLSSIITAAAAIYTANAWKNRPQTSDPVTAAADIPTKGNADAPHAITP